MCKRKKDPAKCCNIVTSIVNLILLVVCYILLAVKFPTGCTLDFDYYGVIVGILSLLVTALIGWNIYTAIDIKNSVKKLEEEIEQRYFFMESKTALSIMNIFMQLRDSLTEKNIDLEYRINYLNYCIVSYGLKELLYNQKSNGNITEDNTLNTVLELLREKKLTVIATQLHELLDTYEKLNIPDKNISKELYELISTIKVSVQSK